MPDPESPDLSAFIHVSMLSITGWFGVRAERFSRSPYSIYIIP